jgi:1-deoxy-D-xylulose-5-phosphate reductoisomerase
MPSSIISSIDDVLAVDKQARELAASLIKKLM